jgi:hypothetical protein
VRRGGSQIPTLTGLSRSAEPSPLEFSCRNKQRKGTSERGSTGQSKNESDDNGDEDDSAFYDRTAVLSVTSKEEVRTRRFGRGSVVAAI